MTAVDPGLRIESSFEQTNYYRLMCVALSIWWMAFLYPSISVTDIVSSLMLAREATAQGNLYNQALILGWALLGLVNAPPALQVLTSPQAKRVLTLLGLYLLWASLTIFWSQDPSLSARRLFSLILLLIGSIGLGAGFYGRTRDAISVFGRHVVWATGICITLLFALRLSNGDLMQFLDPRWSLKYTTQIETYAFPLGFSIVSVVFLYHNKPIRRVALIGFLFLILLLLKGRTLLLDVAAAASMVYSRITRVRLLRAVSLGFAIVSSAILADLMSGGTFLINTFLGAYDSIAPLLPYISIGDGIRNITTLSGRIPLWQALIPRVLESPYRGHGFGAFWTPDRFAEIFAATKWYAVVAHNGFLDEILATGIVGLVLLLAFYFYGMSISLRLGRGGYLVFSWMLLFMFFNTMASVIQSYFQFPTFVAFIGLFAAVSEYSLCRCEECGEKLVEIETGAGELVLCHP